jgi:outer membrane murein-binding lipoprotein Lpp
MSNLGGYQVITTLIKRVGGPENAMKLAAAAGGLLLVAGGAAHAGIQKATPALKNKTEQLFEKWRGRALAIDQLAESVYTITAEAESDQGVSFNVGDTFRVLERDADAVLIEVVGNDDNPWVISADLLAGISDFPSDLDSAGPEA